LLLFLLPLLFHCLSPSLPLQLLGCRGPLADREGGQFFATPARICQVPNHAE
jgi:hypothetical protein